MFFEFIQMPLNIPDSSMVNIKILNQNGKKITKKTMINTGDDIID